MKRKNKKASNFSTALNNIRASFYSQMSYERFTGEESQSSYEISSAHAPFPLEEMANRNSEGPTQATSRSGKAMLVVLFRLFKENLPYLFREYVWAEAYYGLMVWVLCSPLYTQYK